MPSGRRRAAAVAHGTLVFVLGGQNAALTPVEVSTAEAFDTKAETWTTVLAMPTDLGLLAAGRYTASGFYSLVVTGGQDNTAPEAPQRATHTVRLPEYAPLRRPRPTLLPPWGTGECCGGRDAVRPHSSGHPAPPVAALRLPSG